MVLKRAFVSDFESSNCQKPLDIFNRSNYNLCSIDAPRNFDLKILRHFLAKNVSDSPKIQIYVLSIRSISTFGAFGLQIPAIPVRFGENAVVLSIVRVFRCYHVSFTVPKCWFDGSKRWFLPRNVDLMHEIAAKVARISKDWFPSLNMISKDRFPPQNTANWYHQSLICIT